MLVYFLYSANEGVMDRRKEMLWEILLVGYYEIMQKENVSLTEHSRGSQAVAINEGDHMIPPDLKEYLAESQYAL